MARRYKEKLKLEEEEQRITSCELEYEIISKIGNNHKNEIRFLVEVRLVDTDGSETLGNTFYTYKKHLYILDNIGQDCPFLCYEERTRKRIHKLIMNNEFEKDKR